MRLEASMVSLFPLFSWARTLEGAEVLCHQATNKPKLIKGARILVDLID